jgi:hypothetical protein
MCQSVCLLRRGPVKSDKSDGDHVDIRAGRQTRFYSLRFACTAVACVAANGSNRIDLD